MVALTGCGDSKQVTEVKALPFGDANMTVDQALDTRKICDSVDWEVKQDDRNQTYVEYTCKYKDLSDSAFLARDKTTNAESAADVYQWTYGPNGEPTLTAAGFVTRYTNGSVKDFKVNSTAVMQLAVNNKVSSFDEAWSTFFNTPIPKKPAKDITDITYGNKLSELYPNETPLKAATLAYIWRNASSLSAFGLDSLGYLMLEDSDRASAVAFPVDPVDVQIAWKMDPSAVKVDPEVPGDLQGNKLFCLNSRCYDHGGRFVGKTTQDVLTKETAAPAYYGKGVGSQLTTNTPGNAIVLFIPGKKPLQAIHDALAMIHSTLTVTDVDSSGYPIYQVKCVYNPTNAIDQCIDGAGRPIGAEMDVAKQMFPVNGSDVGITGISCNDGVVCIDSRGIVGRSGTDRVAQVLVQQPAQQNANAQQPATPGQAVAQATQPNAPASASTADPLPVGAEDWPTSTPCIKKLEDAYRKDRRANDLDDTISLDQANDFASTCKTVGQ
jgi:hypothetical protein